jgi:hypothetical protein
MSFEALEDFLNSLADVNSEYNDYYIYQILEEHTSNGSLAVVILSRVAF